MLRHVREGVPAAQAAKLASAARFRIAPGAEFTTATKPASEAVAQMLEAIERYDETSAEQVLDNLLRSVTATRVIRDVFLPLLREVGERWADGRLNVAQEHFASAFVLSRLLTLARGWDRGLGPRAVLACPANEQHTLGLIAFGIALREIGWQITYLGADTPIAAVTHAAVAIRPRLTVLSVAVPDPVVKATTELNELSRLCPVAIAGAGADPELAASCGAGHLQGDPITAAESLVA
jgi:methanogenic corrinoid protein MtbC1